MKRTYTTTVTFMVGQRNHSVTFVSDSRLTDAATVDAFNTYCAEHNIEAFAVGANEGDLYFIQDNVLHLNTVAGLSYTL